MHNAIVHNVGENGAPVKPGSRQGVGRDFDQVADPPPGAVGDLLAAGDAGCHDLLLGALGPDGGEGAAVPYGER